MATTLLAILIVVAASLALPDLHHLRDLSWLRAWVRRWPGAMDDDPAHAWPLILLPLLLVVACVLVQIALDHVLFGLPGFAFAVLVLFWCWGPRDLDADIEAVLKAPDGERRRAAVQALRPDPASAPLPFEAAALVEATFASALSRWFGVLFWFVLFGPAGALGYRLVQLLARQATISAEIAPAERRQLDTAARVLDWAPAHLMALTLALVSEFDAVIRTWRSWHAAHPGGWFSLDLGFLGVLARAGVDADVEAGDGYARDVGNPLLELADARTVLRRILVAWLALLALVAISGLAH